MNEQPDNLRGIPQPIKPAASAMAQRDLRDLQAELMSRKIEALRLYEPSPKQREAHACMAYDVIITGGNRGGKSLCAFVEDARCVTNQDPHKKYPHEGVLVILGYGWEHCGKVVYRLLFQKGAFKIIKDQETGQWRTFRPNSEADIARAAEAKPAPPLIPERFLKGGRKQAFAWVNKKMRQFSRVDLTTGWSIYYFASEGDPEQAQGFPVNRAHVDENVHDGRWVSELMSRCADEKGRFCWSTIPGDDRTGALDKLLDDAEKHLGRAVPRIVRIEMTFLDNRYIGAEEKKLTMERWGALGEDEVRRRAYGQSGTSYLMYPSFSMAVHGYDRSQLPDNDVPPSWARYMIVDPGHTVSGSLFVAVPPQGRMMLCYDELYIEQCDGPEWGRRTAEKIGSQQFVAFIIDAHGGNLADLSTGSTWQQVLSKELRAHNLRSMRTGHGFIPACDDIEARANATRLAMYAGNGEPKMRILRGACPNLVRTLPRYHKQRKRHSNEIIDKPENRGDVHMIQNLEYACAYDPQYVKPPELKKRRVSPAVEEFRRERSRQRGSAVVLA